MEPALRGIRPDGVAEDGPVGPRLHPVAPGGLLVGPSGGEVARGVDLAKSDDAVPGRRGHHRVAGFDEGAEEEGQIRRLDNVGGPGVQGHLERLPEAKPRQDRASRGVLRLRISPVLSACAAGSIPVKERRAGSKKDANASKPDGGSPD